MIDGLLQRPPPFLRIASYRRIMEAKLRRRTKHAQPLTVQHHKSGCSPVKALCHLVRPTTISRLVVAVVIDPVECRSFWSLAHVGQEVLKNRPTFTDGNATRGIVPHVFRILSANPFSHGKPRFMCRRMAHSMTGSWLERGSHLARIAAAGYGISRPEAGKHYIEPLATITDNDKHSVSLTSRMGEAIDFPHHSHSAKSLARLYRKSLHHIAKFLERGIS